jgi:hypothetical protein
VIFAPAVVLSVVFVLFSCCGGLLGTLVLLFDELVLLLLVSLVVVF